MYRGIAVPSAMSDEVVASIKSGGLRGDEGTAWSVRMPSARKVRRALESLYKKVDLSTDDIFADAELPGVGACGGIMGATYYGASHNRTGENDQPIVIAFDVALDIVYVDSRDFLCTVFQMWDRETTDLRGQQAATLRDLYGQRIGRYFNQACATDDQQRRIAMCNLASFDSEVVLAHHANRKVIAGRHGTLFTSAFIVQAPIEPESIRDVQTVSQQFEPPAADVALADMWGW